MSITTPTSFDEITYPFDERPDRGKLQQVAPGVHWLAMPMSGSLAYINLYLLEDYDGWWVVDTGLANAETSAVWDEVFSRELGR